MYKIRVVVAKKINVDHDHKTGAWRGVLCHHCNIMLGGARDRLDVLEAAMKYLTDHAADYRDRTRRERALPSMHRGRYTRVFT